MDAAHIEAIIDVRLCMLNVLGQAVSAENCSNLLTQFMFSQGPHPRPAESRLRLCFWPTHTRGGVLSDGFITWWTSRPVGRGTV